MVNQPEDEFVTAFRKKPAKAPRGLLPGRRVATTLVWATATVAAVTLGVTAAGAVVGNDRTDLAADQQPGPSVSAEPTEKSKPAAEDEKKDAPSEEPTKEQTQAAPPAAAPPAAAQPEPEKSAPASEAADEKDEDDKAKDSAPRKLTAQDKNALVDGKQYKLLSALGTCLDRGSDNGAVGTNVVSWVCTTGGNQTFTLREAGRDLYRLEEGGRCVGVTNASTEAGGNIAMLACNESMSQRWSLTEVGDGYRTLAAGHSRYCMDVEAGKSETGTNVRQWHCNSMRAQQWLLKAA
ncbi:RICIN domain-containing protein [Streptomyces sp. NPDC057245]|uniref:RICIN domain-containing protein n=1 Tax=Streptomyces TaxID=1883 RepID=UPI001C1E724C|nr:RICIN domain-containing protein [Streptomyces sp. A108]MBU6533445.1 RICIN domain-containing protein [Streptomyces sp. A108]